VPFTGASRLRELLKDPKKIVVCPGVFDGLTARIALSKGFDALYPLHAGHLALMSWQNFFRAIIPKV
jgi:2-methylisocitrate lyase-like PEP mutase family enzyme